MTLVLPDLGKFKRLAVLGAGTMGTGWITQGAARGVEVVCADKKQSSLDSMTGLSGKLLSIMAKPKVGLLEESEVEPAKGRITCLDPSDDTETLIKGLAECEPDLFIEVVDEKLGLKQEIFELAAQHFGPNVVLASNTSSVLCRRLAAATGQPDRTIVLHGMNPVPLMGGVECVIAEDADPTTRDWCFELFEGWGKEPFRAPDRPGFLINRIMMPAWFQMIEDIQERLVRVQDVDRGFRSSVSHPQGGLYLLEQIGLKIMWQVGEAILDETSDPRYRAPLLLVEMVKAGFLGKMGDKGGFYDWTEPKNPKPRDLEFFDQFETKAPIG